MREGDPDPGNRPQRAHETVDDATVPFMTGVLLEELRLIGERRAGVSGAPAARSGKAPEDPQQASAFGLAFSGGGIRSATFNLGVTQGLAEKGLLPYVDYLSTVSGGGYIGSWLHGVIRNRHHGDPAAAAATLLTGTNCPPGSPDTDPITFLRKYSNYLAPRPGLFSADTWVIAFIWIRNFLLNQLILVPAIAAVVAAALLLVFFRQSRVVSVGDGEFSLVAALAALAGLVVAVVVMIGNLRPIARQSFSPTPVVKTGAEIAAERHAVLVVFGVFIGAVGLAFGRFDPASPIGRVGAAAVFILLMVLIQAGGGFVRCFAERHKAGAATPSLRTYVVAIVHVLWMSTLSAMLTTGLMWAIWKLLMGLPPWTLVAFAPPLVALSLIAGVMLLVGLMGADYPDAAREWTARIGSEFGIGIVAWTALFTLAVFGPWAVAKLLQYSQRLGLGALAAWALTTVGGVLAGSSAKTDGAGASGTKRGLEILVNIAPTVFLVGYVVAIAAGVHIALASVAPPAAIEQPPPQAPAVRYDVAVKTTDGAGVEVKVDPSQDGRLARWLAPVSTFANRYFAVLTLDQPRDRWSRMQWVLLLLAGFVVVTAVASSRINVNEFSLHHFYKNRLVRCYLGASKTGDPTGSLGNVPRNPNPLTGFDALDDYPIAALTPAPGKPADTPYLGPYAIVNTTLNLNTGSELAQQERKAASFIFTPAFCGFDPPSSRESTREAGHERAAGFEMNGYRPTRGYAYPGGPGIGTAMAISGAAANPNWGYHTSGPVAFLLTVFNARLGWWLGNPRWADPSRRPGPIFALKYLFAELLGQTTARSKFVNLSDGGHFDNLGLYELIRRRCRFIIVCDAEEDRKLTFGSLGGAIRKCRADFGVEIDINPDPIRVAKNDFSSAHCVVGRILYPERETSFLAGMIGRLQQVPAQSQARSRGWLLYLKSSLTGDEPADVVEYRSRFNEFPHQSTADQFFSESQFESYRRLGYHVLRSAFEDVTFPPDRQGAARTAADDDALRQKYPLVQLFQDLTRKWYAPIPVPAERASSLADAYVEVMRQLAERPALKPLYDELVLGSPSQAVKPSERPGPELIAFGMRLVQLIENVYTEFAFEYAFNEHNPRNAGWVSVFRKWLKSDLFFNRIWPEIEQDYHPLFRAFVADLRKPDTVDEPTRL